MAERAQLFEENDDFDVSAFKPKTSQAAAPPPEAVRAVSEGVNFRSREPVPPKVSEQKKRRGRRTGA